MGEPAFWSLAWPPSHSGREGQEAQVKWTSHLRVDLLPPIVCTPLRKHSLICTQVIKPQEDEKGSWKGQKVPELWVKAWDRKGKAGSVSIVLGLMKLDDVSCQHLFPWLLNPHKLCESETYGLHASDSTHQNVVFKDYVSSREPLKNGIPLSHASKGPNSSPDMGGAIWLRIPPEFHHTFGSCRSSGPKYLTLPKLIASEFTSDQFAILCLLNDFRTK